LVEILVVTAIIGVLIALLLPAVQAALTVHQQPKQLAIVLNFYFILLV
jgi:type II secretory pathway pseudopilin PulG